MSELQVTPAQQRRYTEVLQEIGVALIEAAPPGWRRLDVIARVAVGVQDIGLTVIMSDSSDAEVAPPEALAHAFAELRSVMDVPQRGAWLSARYTVDPPGAFQVFYNYDHDPLWVPPLPASTYRRDLEAHPRPAEAVPGWLRELIDGADDAGADAVPAPPPVHADRRGGSAAAAPFTVEDQRRLTRTIADLLAMRAPTDRDQIRVMYRGTGHHEEVVAHILGLDGQLRAWQPPPELAGFYRQLRAGMHRPGAGTWTAASTVIEYPIRTTVDYRPDTRWRRQPPRQAVLDELELFPRNPEQVPAWMTDVLPNAVRVAEVAGRFRRARIVDRRDAQGRPVVDRPAVAAAELPGLLHYLDTAPALLAGRGFDADLFDPTAAADVPTAHLTDGTWIWTASVPHYLNKHGVPPEPDLVDHIRANGFVLPPLDDDVADAAYTALTGELPAPRPQGATHRPAPPELTDRDRTTLALIEQRIGEAGVIPQAYRVLGSAEGAICLERVGAEWQVATYERGLPRAPQRFGQLWDAGAYLLGSLTITASAARGGGGDQNTAVALNDWPIQPLPGEPPLTLLSGKHVAVLAPGREVVRHGAPSGNLVFAAETPFGAMSLRAEREQQSPPRYRVERALRTLSGRTVPWHGQTGGGVAYLLPRSVADHLGNGSITEPAAPAR